MNIHELNYVLCIAKHQNMTKAAQELFISQPTLSKHLGKLERELGIKLFSRVDNCYIPTYAGRRYMEYASGVLELTRDWEKELADLRSQNDGELNVAFPLMRSSCMIPRILPAFRRIHPNIRLNFLEETYAIQERLLTDSRIDFAIFSDGSLNPKLEYETLGHEEILLAVSPDHPLARKVRSAACKDNPYPQVDRSFRAWKRKIHSAFSGTEYRCHNRTASEKIRHKAKGALLHTEYTGRAPAGPAKRRDMFRAGDIHTKHDVSDTSGMLFPP